MSMTFFSASTTPLYAASWTPNSLGKYAGTCIFLIVFAALFRAMLALRINFVVVQAALKQRRRGTAAFDAYSNDLKPTKTTALRPWRAQEAVVFATMDVVLAGIGYLLMIAVMTMNVGYFLSVLGGVFLGSLVFGRFMAYSAAH
ncbi:Ctr copper transporter [Clohesyomyces aquaticus]|uniref:Copper transport protein n=1 Tax=Clohesyomyces aquaticus TaxID=1231657 RepID=A0A1Y2AB70_9PLEO|nr:Ctr copper transporter [Clohesyomyces aquaticus]